MSTYPIHTVRAGLDRLPQHGQRRGRGGRLGRAQRGRRPARGGPVAGPDGGDGRGDPGGEPGALRVGRGQRVAAAGCRRGVRARSTSRRASRTVPSGASTTGAEPSSRSRGSSTSSGTSLTTTVGRDPAQPQRRRLGVVHELGQRGLVVAAQERLGARRPGSVPKRRDDVVDEVGQRLRHRGAARPTRGRRAPRPPTSRSRSPADRALGEPVDGGAAARLDVGEQRRGAGPGPARAGPGRPRSGRPGAARGRPARAAAAPVPRGVVQRVVVGEQARPCADSPPSAVTPTTADSSTSPGDRLGAGRGRRGRSQAIRSTSEATPVPAASTVPGSSAATSSSAVRRVSGSQARSRSGDQGVHRLAVLATADQPGQPRATPARPGRAAPSGRRRAALLHRSNASVGSHTESPSGPVADREQLGGEGDLHVQRGVPLVDVQQLGGGLEVAHAQPAGPQRRRRRGAPVLEQQLDVPDQLEGGAGRGPVDQRLRRARRWPAPARRRPGSRVVRPPRRAIATSRGTATCRRSRATSSPRASSWSTGCRRPAAGRWRARWTPPSRPCPRRARCSRIARAWSSTSATRLGHLGPGRTACAAIAVHVVVPVAGRASARGPGPAW